jgi:hypothetical protein
MGYWAVSAPSAKKKVRGVNYGRSMYVRVALFAVIIVVLHFSGERHWSWHPAGAQRGGLRSGIFASMLVRSIGAALCAAGIALAIWARTVMGGNWGMPRSLKENPVPFVL